MEKENSFKAVVGQVKPDVKQSMSSPSVAVGDLPIFVSVGTVSEREEIRRSRTEAFRDDRPLFDNGNKAFTLIELLVVVLIIGILAAVALPQYQKAVEKSRAAQAFAMLKTVYNAAEAYHLANGTYATSFDELSVDIPWTGTQGWTNGNPTRSGSDWAVQLYNNSLGTEPAVTVGRLRGKYRGAGFFVYLKDISLGDKTLQGGVTYCAERVMNGDINFSAEDNSYCGQIFKGVLLNSNTSGPLRYYSLP